MGKGSRKKRARAAGRKHDPAAKRHQTTAEGQGRIDRGAERVRRLRERVLGDVRGELDSPLDTLLTHGLVSVAQRDEGQRWSMLAWWLYGSPTPSCAAVYERMVAEGGGSEFGPRPTGEEADEERLKHIASQKRRFERMMSALQRAPSRLPTVRRICQYLEVPAILERLGGNESASPADLREITLLSEGLERLVRLRNAEDRYRGDAAARAIKPASTTP